MGGGKIDARMGCGIGGGTQPTTMTGTYGPETYRMAMTTRGESGQGSASGMQGMTMKLELEGKRIGECTTAEYAAPLRIKAHRRGHRTIRRERHADIALWSRRRTDELRCRRWNSPKG